MPPLFADFHRSRLLLSVGVLIRNVMQCLRDGRWRRRSLLRFLLLSLSLAAQNRFPFPRDRENHPLLLVEFAAFCIVQSHDDEDEVSRMLWICQESWYNFYDGIPGMEFRLTGRGRR
jgi:hypothetical protein